MNNSIYLRDFKIILKYANDKIYLDLILYTIEEYKLYIFSRNN